MDTFGHIFPSWIMSKRRQIEPFFDETRNRWKVNVPASMTPDKKKLRLWFKTRELARDYIGKISDQSSPAIPPALAIDAEKARSILEPWNLDLVQAAREVAAALKELNGSGSLLEAARAYRLSHEARTASKPLGEAVALYLDSRSDLRDSTQKSYKYTLETTLGPLDDAIMADIETAALEALLAPKAATARAMHQRNLRVFWRWASSPPRQWASMTTVDALEAVRVSSDADIAILSPDDVKALLHAAEAESTAAAAAYAIATFGGVRMAELARLKWDNIHAEYIEIGKAIAKRHSRRLIPICPTLRSWLDATRGDAKDTTSIVPSNWAEVSKSVRRRAGWKVAARLLDNPPKVTRGAWPANGCRHTCASVQAAIGTPLDDLTFKFGHSGGHDLLRKHYVSRLTRKDALKILSIGPNGTEIDPQNDSQSPKNQSSQ